jgi:predicted DNA-binding transcriptional regulator YafY
VAFCFQSPLLLSNSPHGLPALLPVCGVSLPEVTCTIPNKSVNSIPTKIIKIKMKIERLLSIFIYLLNRDLVSARELAERFQVSLRTIQRDIDALSFAGIPIRSVQGPQGGYGIIESFTLDRQLIDTRDLFFILTALESFRATFKKEELGDTLEKVKTLVHDFQSREIARQREKLCIDFGAFSIGKNGSELFSLLEKGIDDGRLVEFTYTDNHFVRSQRRVEPMTIAFKWFSWYFFGYCRLREDFRLFRLSRMQDVRLLPERFTRREKSFRDFGEESLPPDSLIEIVLKFEPQSKIMVEDYFSRATISEDPDGFLIVRDRFPKDEWLFSMLLSHGSLVEVLDPPEIRQELREKTLAIAKKYEASI